MKTQIQYRPISRALDVSGIKITVDIPHSALRAHWGFRLGDRRAKIVRLGPAARWCVTNRIHK